MNMTQLTTLATEMNFGQRAAYAGKMLIIGMGAVFGVLILLWGCLALFRKLLPTGVNEKSVAAPAAPAPMPVVSAPVAKANDDAIIAAITAAVAATLAEENGGVAPAFRVVSFRRVDTVSARRK